MRPPKSRTARQIAAAQRPRPLAGGKNEAAEQPAGSVCDASTTATFASALERAKTVLVGTERELANQPSGRWEQRTGLSFAEVFGLGTSAGFGASSAGLCRKSGMRGPLASVFVSSKAFGPFRRCTPAEAEPFRSTWWISLPTRRRCKKMLPCPRTNRYEYYCDYNCC